MPRRAYSRAETYTATGLMPRVQCFFAVEAVDPSGNTSTSNQAYTTTDADRTPPSTPANLRITNVTASQISLAWDASTDNTGIRDYLVATSPHYGNLIRSGPVSATLVGRHGRPRTRSRSRPRTSDTTSRHPTRAVSATTAASTDVTPPTAPTNLFVTDQYCAEVGVRWTQSPDDRTRNPRSATRSSSTGCSTRLARRSASTGR